MDDVVIRRRREGHTETSVDHRLSDFFAAYEARTNRALVDPAAADIGAMVDAFADAFIHADPNGVRCGRNDAAFRAGISEGLEFYRRIGTTSMRIKDLAATPLDDHHVAVTVQWQAVYGRADGREIRIDFTIVYLVRTISGRPQIFGYVTGDEQKAYRDHGLL